CASGPEAEFTW
nr:immunoglobulin heavy chain junction region [Macaca mulatta]MOW98169.1 immunoglobulin heavy chain junction region [Macaca mulatta]MOW98367.1 immunoglobulin heavy chain junction region [Macaca mulatta]MOW99162.1 immunoglobulin heavy chain junction region [Macaca mulatta]MOW99512.1 immunoglobulin heavy chain junction region [Macaca mulatta]